MSEEAPDLAGMYVTDDYIDIAVGRDQNPHASKPTVGHLDLGKTVQVEHVLFKEHETIAAAFEAAARLVAQQAPALRSLGIASYGPFVSIDREDRGSRKPYDTPSRHYGELQQRSRGGLAGQNLIKLVMPTLLDALPSRPLITVETDVAAAALGLVYTRSRGGASEKERNQVIVFVKASLGIGGAFVRAATPWRGRLHPEMGQFHVPRWQSAVLDPKGIEATWTNPDAHFPGSIEAMASVQAIETRFAPLKFAQLRQEPDHPAWERQAWYLAQLAWAITCVVNPHQIVFGGRILSVPGLIERVRRVFADQIAGSPEALEHVGIAPDDLGNYLHALYDQQKAKVQKPGIVGSLCLAAMEDKPTNLTVVRGTAPQDKGR